MKPQFIGSTFNDISIYLKKLAVGVFTTRTIVSLTPVSVADNSAVEQTFSVPRVKTNESVSVEYAGAQTPGIGILSSRVSATGTLAVTFINPTAGALTPASGDYRLMRIFP